MNRLVASLKRVADEKRKYRQQQERMEALPNDYAYVYRKIQNYMWSGRASVDGMDTLPILADLLDLFETGAAEGRRALDVTGQDVAAFCDELLQNVKASTGNWQAALNHEIMQKIGEGNGA